MSSDFSWQPTAVSPASLKVLHIRTHRALPKKKKKFRAKLTSPGDSPTVPTLYRREETGGLRENCISHGSHNMAWPASSAHREKTKRVHAPPTAVPRLVPGRLLEVSRAQNMAPKRGRPARRNGGHRLHCAIPGAVPFRPWGEGTKMQELRVRHARAFESCRRHVHVHVPCVPHAVPSRPASRRFVTGKLWTQAVPRQTYPP